MKIGTFGCFGATRVDYDQFRAMFCACFFDPLPDDRMTPCGVRSDQQDQIGCIKIVIAARHDIFAKSAAMGGDCAGHAQAAVGVDIGAADKAFHQLVGDIIVLGQQLAGDVECDAIGAMFTHGIGKALRDQIESLAPLRLLAANFRIEQPSFQTDRFRQMRPLGA